MRRLFDIGAGLYEFAEQLVGRVDFVDASVETDDEQHPTKVVLTAATIFQTREQEFFSIGSFFGQLQSRKFLIRRIHGLPLEQARYQAEMDLGNPKNRSIRLKDSIAASGLFSELCLDGEKRGKVARSY